MKIAWVGTKYPKIRMRGVKVSIPPTNKVCG
jgi:hypothetical protein